MPHGDPARIRRMAAQARLDAVLAVTPDNYYYFSGHQVGIFRPGISMALVPTDEAIPLAMTCPHVEEPAARGHSHIADIRPIQTWIEVDEVKDLERETTIIREKPTQFDQEEVIRVLADIVAERRLGRGRIGCELDGLSRSFLESFSTTTVVAK